MKRLVSQDIQFEDWQQILPRANCGHCRNEVVSVAVDVLMIVLSEMHPHDCELDLVIRWVSKIKIRCYNSTNFASTTPNLFALPVKIPQKFLNHNPAIGVKK